jgi:glycine oxidase
LLVTKTIILTKYEGYLKLAVTKGRPDADFSWSSSDYKWTFAKPSLRVLLFSFENVNHTESKRSMSTVIIGGGVIGLSIARELHKRGVRGISVVDRSKVGREASWAAAGMLAPNAETDRIDDLYRFCAESNVLYAKFAKDLLAETGVDVGYNCSGTLELAFDHEKAVNLAHKYAKQRSSDIQVEALQPEDLLRLEPNISPDVMSGLFYPADGQVDNRKLVMALEDFSRRNGIDLIEDTEVSGLLIEDGTVVGVRHQNGTLNADLTILTTGAWTSNIKFGDAPSQLSVKPIRGQMLSMHGPTGVFRSVIYGAGAYLVPRADGRVLVGATVEDRAFDRTLNEDATRELQASAIKTVLALSKFEVGEVWCGFRPIAADGLPIIGEIAGLSNLVVATAHFRNGILLAPLTARIVASLVTENSRSEFLEAFSPARFGTIIGSTLEQ